jgi:hypothetical protein
MATTDPDTSLNDTTYPFHQLDSYPWDEDPEFQGGLRAILGSVQDPAQVEHLTLRAKCYYYARKAGTPVDFNGYKSWVENNHSNEPNPNPTSTTAPQPNGTAAHLSEHMEPGYVHVQTRTAAAERSEEMIEERVEDEHIVEGGDGGMAHAPKPATFAEICEMIAEGKPIPGIKQIPDTILEGQKSETHASKRRKPWEKEGSTMGVQWPVGMGRRGGWAG